ncbi:unnamed protein product [Caenorhabditis nigoni]|uniref:Mos1 transposase HTH domain-containing protein n=1 Tax=Caenorhabditis nigoni TaxID=1611254 RepID=A0A2G5SB19_9PELO|nr:hypothetical protein B9Z55_028643 [Caenorhabditis nigoni]
MARSKVKFFLVSHTPNLVVKNPYLTCVIMLSVMRGEIMEKVYFFAYVLYESMLSRNATETTENINRASAERSANRKTVQRWFTKFTCGDASLEEKKVVEGMLKCG